MFAPERTAYELHRPPGEKPAPRQQSFYKLLRAVSGIVEVIYDFLPGSGHSSWKGHVECQQRPAESLTTKRRIVIRLSKKDLIFTHS